MKGHMRFYSILPFDCFPFISFLFIVSKFFIPISWIGRTLLPICTYSYFFVPSSILLETIKYLFGIYVKFYGSLQEKLWTLLLQTRVRVLSFTSIIQVSFSSFLSLYSFSGNTLLDNWCLKGIALQVDFCKDHIWNLYPF